MQAIVIVRTLGALFLLFSTTLLPPLLVALLYRDGEALHFTVTLGAALTIGALCWFPFAGKAAAIRHRDGFAIVALLWVAMSVLGSVPFMAGLELGFADALFESVSGYTTTGSTVLIGLDTMAPSILIYRQELQWLGGIGFIVMAIALLPMLGIGGMQLYRAEMPGPFKEERFTPRIAHTAMRLFLVYLTLTVLCTLCYWLAGMSAFDAVAHSLTTLSTGGYSTHDTSLAFFDSAAIEAVAIVFMLIGGISFGLHFVVWQTLAPRRYLADSQVRGYVATLLLVTVFSTLVLAASGGGRSFLTALRQSAFEAVSVMTTTGYGVADFSLWPLALPVVFIFLSFVGGCAGSSAGGIKVMRFVILGKQLGVHVQKLIHPRAVKSIRVDERVVPAGVVEGIWGFFAVYIAVFAAFMLVLMMDGMDQITAFGAVATCLNNLGPGLGEVATDFLAVSERSKVVLALAMLMGRLEIFTFFVLVTPAFWRR